MLPPNAIIVRKPFYTNDQVTQLGAYEAPRQLGGAKIPRDQIPMKNYQERWVPRYPQANWILNEPEFYSTQSFAHYNMAFNGNSQPMPRGVSSSKQYFMMPVQYSYGDYTFQNPQTGRFPGVII